MSGTKKKRVSKKLKISWRKHVNINDVEDYLEETRLEERLGPPLATISDNDLFKLDTAPDSQLSSRELKKAKLNKPLKCFSALQPHSKVPDPIKKRNRVRTKEERKNALIKQKEIQDKLKGVLKHKELQSMKDRQLYEVKSKNKLKRGEYLTDIWADDNKNDLENDEWANTVTKKHNLRNLGVPQKQVVKSVTEKTSVTPAIELPHPGMSYNPSFKDHQDLLKIVADKESEFIKKEEYLTRVTRGMFNKVTPQARDNAWIVEMSEGLPSKSNDNQDEVSDSEYKAVNPPVKNKKKTPQQRRKQKEQMELELKRKLLKQEKKKVTDIHQIKLVKKTIDKMNEKQAVLREKRKKRAALKALEPKRISSTKFEEPDLDFNLGQDIAGNLRNLKKEGCLLADRYRNMQKRNILEPTVKRLRKNAKVKRFTKPGHKEDWKKTVAK